MSAAAIQDENCCGCFEGCSARSKGAYFPFVGFSAIQKGLQGTLTGDDALVILRDYISPFITNVIQLNTGPGLAPRGLGGDLYYPVRYLRAVIVHTFPCDVVDDHAPPVPLSRTYEFAVDRRTGLVNYATAANAGSAPYFWSIDDDGTITTSGSPYFTLPPTLQSVFTVSDNALPVNTQSVTMTESTLSYRATSEAHIVLEGDDSETIFPIEETVEITLTEKVEPEDILAFADAIFDGIVYGAIMLIDDSLRTFGWGEAVVGYYARYYDSVNDRWPVSLLYTGSLDFYLCPCFPGVSRTVYGSQSVSNPGFGTRGHAYVMGTQVAVPPDGHTCLISFEHELMQPATNVAGSNGVETAATGLFDRVLDITPPGGIFEVRPEDLLYQFGIGKLFIACTDENPCDYPEDGCF